MKQTEWIKRKFAIQEDSGLLPDILERLEGTPLRIASLINSVSTNQLITKLNNKWSIQEEIGHFGDLEPLWLTRVQELIQGKVALTAADMSNEKTNHANHNSRNIKELLESFHSQRIKLTERIRSMSDDEIEHQALHPRLQTPMRVTDLAYFVAEHDDHHLARIRTLVNAI